MQVDSFITPAAAQIVYSSLQIILREQLLIDLDNVSGEPRQFIAQPLDVIPLA